MKILSLNVWAGREFDPLIKYISEKSADTDIFCFQEVFDTPTNEKIVNDCYRANIYSELEKMLGNHAGHFAPVQDDWGFDSRVDFPLSWGVAMFLKKSIDIEQVGDIFIRGNYNSKKDDNTTVPRNLQYVVFNKKGKNYVVAHFHGLWNGKGKGDCSERIAQSLRVKKFMDNIEGKKILCGDFNLNPDTQSLVMLEEGNVNLIKKYEIKSTRSLLYKSYGKSSHFADYVIASPDVNVYDFEVPNVKVSDHLPMIISFD
ncbi:MAG: endonuclease/exonuclease/phosphatase family protein [Patescibacteria group bacterium]